MTTYHLIDDAGFGGINRMLDHLTTALAETAGKHEIVRVKRGQLSPPRLADAEQIVSHLSVCWKNMPLMTALRARYANTPLVHVEHSYCERFVAAEVENRDRFETLLSAAYALFDKIVAVSAEQGEWLGRKFVSRNHLAVVSPCVRLDEFFALEDKRPTEKIVIGALGRFDRQKGFDILIEGLLLSGRQDVELRLYGSGSEEAQLKARAGTDPRIKFCGFAKSPAAAMADCDLIAMPSRYEPYGLVALEAMAAGRPVAASLADGLSGHVRNGGFGVGDNSPEGWARFLQAFEINTFRRGAVSLRERAKEAEQVFAERWLRLLGDLKDQSPRYQMAA